jgi:hypothetical protein
MEEWHAGQGKDTGNGIDMIRIMLGNPGSGKTACMVREMTLNPSHRKTYSNIITNGVKNHVLLTHDMIIKRDVIGQRRDGTDRVKFSLNADFWKGIKEPINVILDEAHAILNARKSMTLGNVIVTDWLSLIRRVLGSNASGYGELTLISQLPNRIDCIARDMSTHVRFHRCHFTKRCKKCSASWKENNDTAEPLLTCPICSEPAIERCEFLIEVWHFRDMTAFQAFMNSGAKTFHKHYLVNDIEKYFPLYHTRQWDNLISGV